MLEGLAGFLCSSPVRRRCQTTCAGIIMAQRFSKLIVVWLFEGPNPLEVDGPGVPEKSSILGRSIIK